MAYAHKSMVTVLAVLVLMATASTSRALGWPTEDSLNNGLDTLEGATDGRSGEIVDNLQNTFDLSQCRAESCNTLDGAIKCLKTDDILMSYLKPKNFFQPRSNLSTKNLSAPRAERIITWQEAMQRRRNPIQEITHDAALRRVQPTPIQTPSEQMETEASLDDTEESQKTYREVQTVITQVRPQTYKAFVRVAREHPHCMRNFCHKNCLSLVAIDSKSLKKQAAIFMKAVVPITIRGKTYSVRRLREMDDDYRMVLARDYLIDARNSTVTAQCLANDQRGILVRMLCSHCEETLHAERTDVNVTCTSFVPTRDATHDLKAKDLDEAYQERLGAVAQQQKEITDYALRYANSPGSWVDLPQLVSELNKAAEGLS